MMILCVTPNVALDRTLVVPGYGSGGVFRPQQVIAVAGGKGVNVARVIRLLGGASSCFGFIAGHTGSLVASVATAEGLACHWTRLASGETRVCTILVDPALEQTSVINEYGVATTGGDWAQLRHDLFAHLGSAAAVCFCGSLPPDSLEAFTALLTDLQASGKPIWVDTSGAALRAAAQVQGIHIKVNDEEAGELLGFPVSQQADAVSAAYKLAGRLGASAVITLGKRGAVLSDGQSTWHAQPPNIEAKSGVGSGDSFLAGLLVSLESGSSPAQALRCAVAAGAANALSVGGGQFALEDYQRLFAGTTLTEQTPLGA